MLFFFTLAAGSCISLLAYQTFHKKNRKAVAVEKKKLEIELTLDQGHIEWLEKSMEEYSLPSLDKAIRIVLSYAQQSANEMLIFEKVRCNFCTNKQKVTRKHIIDSVHDEYLDEMVSKHKLASKDKAVRIVLDYAMTSVDGATIFQVKRCAHGDSCKNC